MQLSRSFVYILTNKSNSVFYVGVTTNLFKRVWEHRNVHDPKSFTTRYAIYKLVYYETIDSIENAIKREKVLKGWNRERKIHLIECSNKEYNDLYNEINEIEKSQ